MNSSRDYVQQMKLEGSAESITAGYLVFDVQLE